MSLKQKYLLAEAQLKEMKASIEKIARDKHNLLEIVESQKIRIRELQAEVLSLREEIGRADIRGPAH